MSLKFGTSGVRGLATEFTRDWCFRYVAAFISILEEQDLIKIVVVAGDLRQSTPQIKTYVTEAVRFFGWNVLDGGNAPTPALAFACSKLGASGIMVTGSHIPSDRNGLKFYFPHGEILKDDEAKITSYVNSFDTLKFSPVPKALGTFQSFDIISLFTKRYVDSFPGLPLSSLKIGFYEHSSVARDVFPHLLRTMGAEVHSFGRSEYFVAVDTEAVENLQYMKDAISFHNLDLVISTDGDADRPLVVTDAGAIIPGEILGLITSLFLGIETIVYPINCSSIVSECQDIKSHVVTKIGSPFVLEEIVKNKSNVNRGRISGFEANGGFILASEIMGLTPLLTRDSLLPILGLLFFKKKTNALSMSVLMKNFSARFNISALLRNFSEERSRRALDLFKNLDLFMDLAKIHVNELDGIRVTFEDLSIVHLRASGNAPEFRIYIETHEELLALKLLDYIKSWAQNI